MTSTHHSGPNVSNPADRGVARVEHLQCIHILRSLGIAWTEPVEVLLITGGVNDEIRLDDLALHPLALLPAISAIAEDNGSVFGDELRERCKFDVDGKIEVLFWVGVLREEREPATRGLVRFVDEALGFVTLVEAEQQKQGAAD